MIKKGDYEVAEEAEIKELTKKHGIRLGWMHSEGEFYSPDVTIRGKTTPRMVRDWQGITVVSHRSDESCQKLWQGISEAVPGLRCPYCNSQAFRTDHPSIAVCGAAPGWFMFYRRTDMDVRPATRYVLKNGELVEETDQSKEEGSF